ncbi:MAG TPA: HAD family phosphatase [Polyangiaceae bacterium]|nr:HAD family phosphatase [Polyangiaceae bacterium]
MSPIELPPGDFAGFIFDCDGTLADSMPLYHRAWQRSLAAHGASFEFTWELFMSRAGMSTVLTVEGLNASYGTSFEASSIAARQELEFLAVIDSVKPIEAVVGIARAYAGQLPMSVASGGTRPLVERTLELIGVRDLFPVVVVAADVPRGKPEPDLFLLAAARMGVAPERCLVFEDGVPGLLAAERAGMQSVFVTHGSRT